jgi:hypothetical protein
MAWLRTQRTEFLDRRPSGVAHGFARDPADLSECGTVQVWLDELQILVACVGVRTKRAAFVRFVVAEVFSLTPEARLELQQRGYPYRAFLAATEACRTASDFFEGGTQ